MSQHGYTDRDASFTISNIGITNTIGMVSILMVQFFLLCGIQK